MNLNLIQSYQVIKNNLQKFLLWMCVLIPPTKNANRWWQILIVPQHFNSLFNLQIEQLEHSLCLVLRVKWMLLCKWMNDHSLYSSTMLCMKSEYEKHMGKSMTKLRITDYKSVIKGLIDSVLQRHVNKIYLLYSILGLPRIISVRS